MRGTLCNVSIILSLCLLGTTGCARTSQGVSVKYVDRAVVQVEKCFKKEDRPTRPKSLKEEGLPADLEKALAVSLAKVSEFFRYSNKTEAILDSCQN